MTTKTQSVAAAATKQGHASDVAAQVEAIRERLSICPELTPEILADAGEYLADAIGGIEAMMRDPENGTPDYAAIELWARLAADLAGMLQRQKPDNSPVIHGKWAKEGLEGPK